MIDSTLSYIAPHYCILCGKIGREICICCKNNIQFTPPLTCVLCNKFTASNCRNPLCGALNRRQIILAKRDGAVKDVIDNMKFNHIRENAIILAELLQPVIQTLPIDAIIVPIPSSSSHIRARGFDHTRLIAKAIQRNLNIRTVSLLGRLHNKQQVGNGRMLRIAQAKNAFYIRSLSGIEIDTPIFILDDIITTGATMSAAINCVSGAGYSVDGYIALAYQPLADKK